MTDYTSLENVTQVLGRWAERARECRCGRTLPPSIRALVQCRHYEGRWLYSGPIMRSGAEDWDGVWSTFSGVVPANDASHVYYLGHSEADARAAFEAEEARLLCREAS